MINQSDKFDIAHLINKFYERYPLESFKTDEDRSFALGAFLSGAEIQRLGEYIVWDFEPEEEDDY